MICKTTIYVLYDLFRKHTDNNNTQIISDNNNTHYYFCYNVIKDKDVVITVHEQI